MTEQIKVAKAWGHRSSPSALLHHAGRKSDNFNVPYLIVSGLSDPEAAALPEIMERERGVCTQKKVTHDGPYGFEAFGGECKNLHFSYDDPKQCPSCGRRVKIK